MKFNFASANKKYLGSPLNVHISKETFGVPQGSILGRMTGTMQILLTTSASKCVRDCSRIFQNFTVDSAE